MIKVLFVNFDTTATLPLAVGLWRKLIADNDLSLQFSGDGATLDFDLLELPPHPDVQKLAHKHDFELDFQIREFEAKNYEEYDYILVLDHLVQAEILNLKWKVLSPKATVYMLRQFDHAADNLNMPEPYYKDHLNLAEVYEVLDRTLVNLLEILRQEFRL